MILHMNMMFLASSMPKDKLEDAVFGMWHWRVGGHIHRKFQSLLSWKGGQENQNSTATGTVLLSTLVTLSALASQ